MLRLFHGDALTKLAEIESESVQTCVTSPPYWGLRDYGVAGQLGLEETPDEYVAKSVEIFREVRRVLRKDGTLWLNLGDSYASGEIGRHDSVQGREINGKRVTRKATVRQQQNLASGVKPKDLVGIPWMVAFALRTDGWYLRSDIIWSKPNPMPESVTDRPTKAHEYIFLLAKSQKYYFDQDAVREPHQPDSLKRYESGFNPAVANNPEILKANKRTGLFGGIENMGEYMNAAGRNIRTVWTVTTHGFPDAHFATFPPDLIKPCILAGAPVGGVVLDPFAGSGTTGKVAIELGRRAILIEPKDEYVEMIERRCRTTIGLPFGGEASELEMIAK